MQIDASFASVEAVFAAGSYQYHAAGQSVTVIVILCIAIDQKILMGCGSSTCFLFYIGRCCSSKPCCTTISFACVMPLLRSIHVAQGMQRKMNDHRLAGMCWETNSLRHHVALAPQPGGHIIEAAKRV